MSASKWTREARGALIERAAAGASLADSCRAAGLRLQTVKSWITRGRREGEGEFAEFVAALDSARLAARERPEAMTAEEFRRHLDTAVRAGSVAAMKLWAELERRRTGADDEPGEQPPSKIAELAAHRARRSA